MYKNIAATLQNIERAQRHGRRRDRTTPSTAAPEPVAPVGVPLEQLKLGPLQKIVAFGPLTP